MTNRLFNNLLLFTLSGIAMWFFGNFYEGIVLGPNMIENSVQRMHAWQCFYAVTNPIFYYVPFTQLATLALIFLYFRTPKQKTTLKRLLKLSGTFQIASLLLTLYIITQINVTLFFGELEKHSDEIPFLASLWNVLNVFRVLLVGIALSFIFRAYIQAQKEMPV